MTGMQTPTLSICFLDDHVMSFNFEGKKVFANAQPLAIFTWSAPDCVAPFCKGSWSGFHLQLKVCGHSVA